MMITLALMMSHSSMLSHAWSASDHPKAHWGYEGETGPDHWGDLQPDFHECKEGKKQSPVDIRNTKITVHGLDPITFNYKESGLKIINNGHTIQVNYGQGSSITFSGKTYDLLQFHFHSPSEHTSNGKAHSMEAHLVHKNQDGELAVVGVFLTKGKQNDFIETLWTHLPKKIGQEEAVENVRIQAVQLLPAEQSFYRYQGSLTTPPCSEGVVWSVMKTPVEVSEEQISRFTAAIHDNARPVQSLNERVIREWQFYH
jgi:carbonic anhydrase